MTDGMIAKFDKYANRPVLATRPVFTKPADGLRFCLNVLFESAVRADRLDGGSPLRQNHGRTDSAS